MPLIIRTLAPGDHEFLVDQFHQLNLVEESIVQNRRLDRQGAVEALSAARQRIAETDGIALVAERDGCVVGHLFLTLEKDPIYVREELRPYAYVSELLVSEEARLAGVATALMGEAERFAQSRGVNRLVVGVLVGNSSATAFYKRLGFVPHLTELVKRIGQ